MRIAITGAGGFFGQHLRVRLRAAGHHEVIPISREVFADRPSLAKSVSGADVVVHLAGVNRADPKVVESLNQALAVQLVAALDEGSGSPRIVFANSVHAGTDTPYGRGKQAASEVLASWAARRGSGFVNVIFQNLFGEGGRPDYNSFVATFCDRLASGRPPAIGTDRSLELIHAQDAAQILIDVLTGPLTSAVVVTRGVVTTVGEVLARLTEISDAYHQGTFPDVGDPFTRQLFNTYRSFLFPDHYPVLLAPRSDERGSFVESVRSTGGQSQTSYSTTIPGVTRGNHFHLQKVERFLVLQGSARIAVRRVYGSQVHLFDVSGETPAFVDIPTLHTHNITNVGDGLLYTLFWADELFDPANADTFIEPVL